MKSIVILLAAWLIFLCGKTDAADETPCSDDSTVPSLLLRRKLFCNYDRNVRPVKFHTNVTDISVSMWLKFMLFHNDWNTLEVHSWMVWKWQDAHLTWDPTDFDGQATMQVNSADIWVPDIALYSSADLSNVSPQMADTHCHLDPKGTVICVSPTVHSALCNPDITRWPFDTHNCTMRIGSWAYTGAALNLTLSGKGLATTEYSENRDWELLSSQAILHGPQYKNATYPFIGFSFVLKRHSGGPAACVFIPAFVLATITLTIFFLEASSMERVGVICFNILCHCLYLQYMGTTLPSNGSSYPLILLFYRDSLLMVAVSLVLTLVVRRMDATSGSPPGWITAVIDVVLATPPGQLLLLGSVDPKSVANATGTGDSEDDAGLVSATPDSRRWRLFSLLVDRASFIFYLLTFVILLTAFVP